MDSGTVALGLTCILWVLFLLWIWNAQKFMENAHKLHVALGERQDMHKDDLDNLSSRLDATQALYDSQFRNLQKRTAGVEALLVSTVGQETEDFCRTMDALMDKMEKREPAPRLTLSKEHCGKFGKKGAK
jgi:hypothetical protein